VYVVAIGWLFVAAMIAITAGNVTAGVLSFLFYGLLPLALLLWLMGGPRRRRRPVAPDDAAAEGAQPTNDAKPGTD
jgi:hypothetical protein